MHRVSEFLGSNDLQRKKLWEINSLLMMIPSWEMVAHTFNYSFQDAEASRSSVSSRLAWSKELIPGQASNIQENLSQK